MTGDVCQNNGAINYLKPNNETPHSRVAGKLNPERLYRHE